MAGGMWRWPSDLRGEAGELRKRADPVMEAVGRPARGPTALLTGRRCAHPHPTPQGPMELTVRGEWPVFLDMWE